MRLVAHAEMAPARCAVLPAVTDCAEGFIDTGSEMIDGGNPAFDQRVYVSVLAVREMGAMVGLVDAGPVRAEVAAALDRAERAEAELAEAHRALDAVDIMESAGFTRRRKTGRPPKQPVEA